MRHAPFMTHVIDPRSIVLRVIGPCVIGLLTVFAPCAHAQGNGGDGNGGGPNGGDQGLETLFGSGITALPPRRLARLVRNGPTRAQRRRLLSQWSSAVPGVDFVPGEILVGFRPRALGPAPRPGQDLSLAEIAALDDALRAAAERLAEARNYRVLDTSPVLRMALMEIGPGQQLGQELRDLNASRLVSFAEPNGIARGTLTWPTDPGFGAQSFDSMSNLGAMSLVGVQRAWDTIPADFGVRVAVIDSGFHFEHPDQHPHIARVDGHDFVRAGLLLRCNGTLVQRDWDFAGLDPDPSDEMALAINAVLGCPADGNPVGSHGTQMTGIIASAWGNATDGVGIIGRVEDAPDNSRVDVIPVKVLDVEDRGTFFDIAQGILYAAGETVSDGQGGFINIPRADIANMSLAGSTLSFFQFIAINIASARGMLLIASAANDGLPVASFPAAFGQVVAVSQLEGGSNTGSWIELTAPGLFATTGYDYSGCPVPLGGIPCQAATGGVDVFQQVSGASAATAVVTGIAALYKAHNDAIGATGLRRLLRDNAADVMPPGVDSQTGLGLVQAAPGRGVALVTDRGPMSLDVIVAATGAIAASTTVPRTGPQAFQYNIPLLAAGEYYVLVTTDEDLDGRFGETGEPLGTIGGAPQIPVPLVQAALGPVAGTVNFPLVWPDQEPEPANDTPGGAGLLFVGHYAEVAQSAVGDVDHLRVLISVDGTYKFWTEGRNTATCRSDLDELDALIELLDASGAVLDFADNDFFGAHNCESIEAQLTAGTYYIRVSPSPLATPEADFAIVVHADRVGN